MTTPIVNLLSQRADDDDTGVLSIDLMLLVSARGADDLAQEIATRVPGLLAGGASGALLELLMQLEQKIAAQTYVRRLRAARAPAPPPPPDQPEVAAP